MKITKVEVLHIRSPIPAFTIGGGVVHPIQFDSTVVLINTDEGVTGVGQSWLSDAGDMPLTVHVRNQLAPLLIGEDPLATQRLWSKLWAVLYRMGGFARGLSAIDQALWDIKGKVAGLPVYQLLGGKAQDRITAYATSPARRDSLKDLISDIERLHQHGFRATKLIVGVDRSTDIEVITEVHRQLGDKVHLAMDANGGLDSIDALVLARVGESLGFMWFEEPLPWYDIPGLAALTRKVDIPVSGFQEVSSAWRMREYLQADALSIYNVMLETCGGITASRKMSVLAEAWDRRLAPHGFGPPIAFAATLQVAIAHPNCRHVEFPVPDRTSARPGELLAPYIRNRAEFSLDADGCVSPPNRPGLGVELDEELLRGMAMEDRT